MGQHDHYNTAVDHLDSGDVEALRTLLTEHPDLANARGEENAPLIIRLIDFPGHRPNAAESARALLDAGAEVDARRDNENGTALGGALSTSEVDVIRVLLEGGADIHAPCGWRDGTVLDFADKICEDETRLGDSPVNEVARIFSEASGRPVPKTAPIGRPTPLLFVKDVDEGMTYYREKMGFSVDWSFESDCDDRYAGISRGGTEFHMTVCLCDDRGHVGKLDTRISCDDIDRLYEELKSKGVTIRDEIGDRPWGFREFETEDPDGNRFTFYKHI